MILEPHLDIAGVHDTLVGKIRQYFATAGMKKAVLGLSGGIDSAIVAKYCLILPTRVSWTPAMSRCGSRIMVAV